MAASVVQRIKENPLWVALCYVAGFVLWQFPLGVLQSWSSVEHETIPDYLAKNGWPRLRYLIITWYGLFVVILAVSLWFLLRSSREHARDEVEKKAESTQPSIRKEFLKAYKLYKDKLGGHRGDPELLEFAYYAKHQSATVLWVEQYNAFYLLGKNFRWKCHDDPFPPEDTWFIDADNKKRFNTPDECFPPWAGVAKAWANEPSKWEWIGCREEHCFYLNAIYVQKCEHGLILGGYPRNKKDKRGAKIFVLVGEYEGEWTTGAVEKIEGADCVAPPTSKAALKKWQAKYPNSRQPSLP